MQNDKQEINDVAPSSIRHLIGQKGVIDQVTVALTRHRWTAKKFDNSLARWTARLGQIRPRQHHRREKWPLSCTKFLGRHQEPFRPPLIASCRRSRKTSSTSTNATNSPSHIKRHSILALDKKKIVVTGGKGKSPGSIPLANFTVLLSTTDEYNLLQPLRDRMRLTLRFDYYCDEDLETVVQHSLHRTWLGY